MTEEQLTKSLAIQKEAFHLDEGIQRLSGKAVYVAIFAEKPDTMTTWKMSKKTQKAFTDELTAQHEKKREQFKKV